MKFINIKSTLFCLTLIACCNTLNAQTNDSYDKRHEHGHRHHHRGPKVNYGKNVIAVSPLSFLGSYNSTDMAIGLSYERMLDKDNHFSIYVPVYLGISNVGDDDYLSETKFCTTPGVKFYPTGNNGKVRYAVGILMYYSSGTQEYDDPWASYPQRGIYTNTSTFGVMLSNSINIYPIPHLYLGLELDLGLTYSDNRRRDNGLLDDLVPPLEIFTFNIGYRF